MRIIRLAKFRKNHYYMLAVVWMIFRVRRAGGADWERGLQIQQVAGTQKHHVCRRTFQVPAVSHHQRRENPHAFQNHLDGPKVLGIFYHFLPGLYMFVSTFRGGRMGKEIQQAWSPILRFCHSCYSTSLQCSQLNPPPFLHQLGPFSYKLAEKQSD